MIRFAAAWTPQQSTEIELIKAKLADAQLQGVDLNGNFEQLNEIRAFGLKLSEAGIEIACVGGAVAVPKRLSADTTWLDPARQLVMIATELDCPQFRLRLDFSPEQQRHFANLEKLAEQLASLAEFAQHQSVIPMIENAPPLHSPRLMWRLLEQCAGLSIDCAFNARFASLEAQSPARAIATLNLKTGYVVSDDPQLPLPADAVHRLLGVGYCGWVVLPDNATPEFRKRFESNVGTKKKPAGKAGQHA